MGREPSVTYEDVASICLSGSPSVKAADTVSSSSSSQMSGMFQYTEPFGKIFGVLPTYSYKVCCGVRGLHRADSTIRICWDKRKKDIHYIL